MSDNLLCVSNQAASIGCVLQKNKNGLEIVFSDPQILEKIKSIINLFREKGVRVRHEYFPPGQIDVDRVEVAIDDPRYFAGCMEEFNLLGWRTFIYPPDKAEIWRKLYELPVPNDLRATFGMQLNILSKEALCELNEILDRAEKRLSAKK